MTSVYLHKHFIKQDTQMANKYMQDTKHHLSLIKMQIKAMKSYTSANNRTLRRKMCQLGCIKGFSH